MELPTHRVLTIEAAKRLADFAKEYAAAKGHPQMAIVVVDAGGDILYIERMDGVAAGTVPVGILKAQASASFRVSSKTFKDAVGRGLVGLIAMPGIAAFEGAAPIRLDDQVIGAISISGLTEEVAGETAHAAADALATMI